MVKRTKRTSLKAKVGANAHKQKTTGAQYGYLSLPKGVQMFKEQPKDRPRLDFIPYTVSDPKHPDRDDDLEIATPGDLWYKRPFWVHRNIGAEDDSAVCPTTSGNRCPVCEFRSQRIKEGASYQDDDVKALRAKLRNLYVVIPIDHKEYEEEPHIWDISQYLFQDKLNDELEEDENYQAFPDLEEGLTLRLRFSEEKLGSNTFASTSRIDFEERKEGYDDSILDKAPDLDQVLSIKSYKQLEALFYELDENEPEPEEPEEKPAKRRDKSAEPEEKEETSRRKKKSAQPAKDEPEGQEDEEPVSENDEEPEEEEVVEDAPEEEDTSEEDEPEEPPKKANKGAKKKAEEVEDGECPHGYRFGQDTDEYEECDTCPVWEACADAMEVNS